MVREDSEQPGQQRPSLVPARLRLDRGQERRLHEILGGGEVARDVAGDAQQFRRRAIEDLRERGRISRAAEGSEELFEGSEHVSWLSLSHGRRSLQTKRLDLSPEADELSVPRPRRRLEVRSTVAAMTTPCSVKARTGLRRPPQT